MLTLFKNIKSSLKINLFNFENDRHMRHNKPQIDHVNVNFCWCYWGKSAAESSPVTPTKIHAHVINLWLIVAHV